VETKELEDNNSELKSENDDLKRGDYNEDDKIELLLTERKWLRTEILELKGEVADYEEALKEQEREMKHQSADFFKNWARWNHRIVD
jgi:predicted  nucleic acid-binding Zn-ribbon protein